MKLRPQSRLASRILLMVAGVVAVTASASLTISLLQLGWTLDAEQRHEGIALADSIARSSELGVLTGDAHFLASPFSAVAGHPKIVFVAAYDAQGALIAEQSRQKISLVLPAEIAKGMSQMTAARSGGTIGLHDGAIDDFYAPVKTEAGGDEWSESLLGETGAERTQKVAGLVRIGLSRQEILAARRQAIGFSVSVAGIVMTVAILFASVISRRITRPIVELEGATRRISEGDLDVELEVSTSDEVGSLAGAFNAMAGALRQTTVSKDYVDSIVASMNDVLVVLSADRMIAAVNDAAERTLGYARDELAGKTTDLIFAEANPLDSGRWEDFARGLTMTDVETRLRTKEGPEIPVSLSVAPMFDRQGHLRGAVLLAHDVSETQRLLDELRLRTADLERHRVVLTSMLEDNDRARALAEAERMKTQTAVDAMSEGLIMFGPTGELLLINPSARRILLMPEDEAATTPAISRAMGFDLTPFFTAGPDDRSAHLLHDLALGGQTKHTIRIEGMPLGTADRRLGAMLVLRDVTRERQLDEAKHELITNVSHELRTPLAAIANIISNALVGVTGPVTDKLRSHLEIARINSKRLSNIIDNLIDIASLDAGHVVIHRAPVDFLALADEAARGVEPEMEQKRIKFDRQIPAEPLEVYCDPIAISQIIRNLLSNAARYTPQDTVVRFTVERLEGVVEVAVIDSGAGISPEEQLSIFERFHQVGRTYGPGEKGLGLGLPISRHLVEMHGGSIGLTSAIGRGSRFHFRLPLFEGEALIAAYLGDRLAELAKGGMRPYVWLFSPRDVEGPFDGDREDLHTTMLERLESAVRETLAEMRSLVVHIAPRGEVTAIVLDRGEETMERLAAKIEAAFRRFSFTYEDRRIVWNVAIAHAACVDPLATPAHYLETLRRTAM